MSHNMREEMRGQLCFIIPMFVFIVIMFSIPYDYNFVLNDSIEDPAWFRYTWWSFSGILAIWMHVKGKLFSGNILGTLFLLFLGPISLVALGLLKLSYKYYPVEESNVNDTSTTS